MAITRLSGGLTPANGSDPRTFPAIFNGAADDIEAAESAITALESTVSGLEIDDLADVDITTPADGEVLVYDDGDWVNQELPASGKILQVVYAEKTDTQTFTSIAPGATAAVTGLEASITPSSTSSKILALVDFSGTASDIAGVESARGPGLILRRDTTIISVGDADGSRPRVAASASFGTATPQTAAFVILDSPNTTSSINYNCQVVNVMFSTANLFINRSEPDANNGSGARTASRITLMEVAG